MTCSDGLDIFLHIPADEPGWMWSIIVFLVGAMIGAALVIWAFILRRL